MQNSTQFAQSPISKKKSILSVVFGDCCGISTSLNRNRRNTLATSDISSLDSLVMKTCSTTEKTTNINDHVSNSSRIKTPIAIGHAIWLSKYQESNSNQKRLLPSNSDACVQQWPSNAQQASDEKSSATTSNPTQANGRASLPLRSFASSTFPQASTSVASKEQVLHSMSHRFNADSLLLEIGDGLDDSYSRNDLRNTIEAFTSDALAKEVERGYDPLMAMNQANYVSLHDCPQNPRHSTCCSLTDSSNLLSSLLSAFPQDDKLSTLEAFGVIDSLSHFSDVLDTSGSMSLSSRRPSISNLRRSVAIDYSHNSSALLQPKPRPIQPSKSSSVLARKTDKVPLAEISCFEKYKENLLSSYPLITSKPINRHKLAYMNILQTTSNSQNKLNVGSGPINKTSVNSLRSEDTVSIKSNSSVAESITLPSTDSAPHIRGILKNSMSTSIPLQAGCNPNLIVDHGGQTEKSNSADVRREWLDLANITPNPSSQVPGFGDDFIHSFLKAHPDLGQSSQKTSTPLNISDAGMHFTTAQLESELPEMERRLKQRMRPAVFIAGEYIIYKHDIGQQMYFLSKGKVEVVSANGKVQYSVINCGSFFGELGVLFDIPRTASVRAIENCICMVLTRKNLEEVMKSFPAISERFQQVVLSRMEEVNKKRASAKRVTISYDIPGVQSTVEPKILYPEVEKQAVA